jgi:hypothetical protein
MQIVQKLPLGFTRNAVVGMVHRAGLTIEHKKYVHPLTRTHGHKRPPAPKKPRIISPPKNDNPVERILVYRIISANGNSNALRLHQTTEGKLRPGRCVEIAPLGLTFDQLERNSCRYPEGDGPVTFCGHIQKEGSSYCIAHHALCWVKPLPPKQPYVREAA